MVIHDGRWAGNSGPFGVADEVDRERDRIGLVYRIRNRVKAYEATFNVRSQCISFNPPSTYTLSKRGTAGLEISREDTSAAENLHHSLLHIAKHEGSGNVRNLYTATYGRGF